MVTFPEQYEKAMRALLGDEGFLQYQASFERDYFQGIRVNTAKLSPEAFEKRRLARGGAPLKRVPWCESGFYLEGETADFSKHPDYFAGLYYLQEPSAMAPAAILPIEKGDRVLDLCAAPGGKSTFLSAKLGDDGFLMANDISPSRAKALLKNLELQGARRAVVVSENPYKLSQRFPEAFTKILVDAPCSGEGMFRKDEQARAEWSPAAVRKCAERQRSIMMDAWDALKPGGILIYSTCTFNEEENEKNVEWIADSLGAEVLPIDYDPSWGITEGTMGYHFYPHKTKGEGFYICALRKNDDEPLNMVNIKPKNRKENGSSSKAEYLPVMRSWLQHPDEWAIRYSDRFATAYPMKFKEICEYLSDQMTCISMGFGLGEERGKGIAPQHSLSMIKDLQKEAFPTIALTREQALSYLRTEALLLGGVPLGLILLTYEGVPIGFAKNVGNRLNNLYPNEWRIRKL